MLHRAPRFYEGFAHDFRLEMGRFGPNNRSEPEPDRTEPRFGVQVRVAALFEPDLGFWGSKIQVRTEKTGPNRLNRPN